MEDAPGPEYRFTLPGMHRHDSLGAPELRLLSGLPPAVLRGNIAAIFLVLRDMPDETESIHRHEHRPWSSQRLRANLICLWLIALSALVLVLTVSRYAPPGSHPTFRHPVALLETFGHSHAALPRWRSR